MAGLIVVPTGFPGIFETLVYGCSVGLLAAKACQYKVEQGHNAIVHNRITGTVKDKVYPAGFHQFIPWFQRPVSYNMNASPHLIESTAKSGDLHEVKVSLQIMERPMPEKLPALYRTLGKNYNERILPSISKAVNEIVGEYKATQLVTQREVITKEIVETATQRARDLNVALDKVAITSITFRDKEAVDKELKQEADKIKFTSQLNETKRPIAQVISDTWRLIISQ
ncbi:hypothetical protein ACHQM5_017719 [Ranunculus cassubicifolius]